MRREPAKRHLGWKAAAVGSDVRQMSTANKGSEGCCWWWWIGDVGGGVLVQVNENLRKTTEQVSRQPRHQKTVGLNELQYPLWRGRQDRE